MSTCRAPILEETLLDYWAGDLADGDEMNRVEEHLFACGDCSGACLNWSRSDAVWRRSHARGASAASSPALLSIGCSVMAFMCGCTSLLPGETVPCAVFPDDDLIVTSLRADFSNVDAVTVSVTGPGHTPFMRFDGVPVSGSFAEVLWATPAAFVDQLPSMRLEITLTSMDDASTELGRYVLDHSSSIPRADGPP